jgi:hypothetical protein
MACAIPQECSPRLGGRIPAPRPPAPAPVCGPRGDGCTNRGPARLIGVHLEEIALVEPVEAAATVLQPLQVLVQPSATIRTWPRAWTGVHRIAPVVGNRVVRVGAHTVIGTL